MNRLPIWTLAAGALCWVALPAGASAQTPADRSHDHAAHAADPAHDPAAHAADPAHDHGAHEFALSEVARAQIALVEAGARQFDRPDAALAGGFAPALGLIPTMGTHWVNRDRMVQRTIQGGVDLARPEHLMFAPVNGVETLVGAAFAYQARPGQPTPDPFDGDLDHWHTHPELSPAGRELTMLHVWFVPSPDGPFAGHNPWLPYMAVGLEPPDAARLADPADSYRIRALALALAETVQPFSLGAVFESLPFGRLAEGLDRRREEIRAEIPRLREASASGDLAAWNAAADRAVANFEAIRSTYLAAVRQPERRERLAAFYDEMLTGAHGAHE